MLSRHDIASPLHFRMISNIFMKLEWLLLYKRQSNNTKYWILHEDFISKQNYDLWQKKSSKLVIILHLDPNYPLNVENNDDKISLQKRSNPLSEKWQKLLLENNKSGLKRFERFNFACFADYNWKYIFWKTIISDDQ